MEFILLTAIIILIAIYKWFSPQEKNIPPYPKRPLPIVGHLFYLSENPRPQLKEWRKQCGDLYSLNMCGTLTVVLNGYDLIKEALVKKADAFSDRTPVFIDSATGVPGKGIGFSSGPNWKEQRSVALTILRKFGMGKNILADKIQEEVSAYVDYLANKKGQPINLRTITNISSANVICSIILGHRFDYDDKEFQTLITRLNNTTTDQQNASITNFISGLQYLPGDLFGAKRVINNVQAVFTLLKKFIEVKDHDNIDFQNVDNFIEAYIGEKNKKMESGVSTFLDNDNLTKSINDLFAAGTETTSTTVYWCVLYMLNYPGIQEKVYHEVKEQVGTERTPNMQDRFKLPYLNAVILETQRLASIVPLSLMHMCSEDVTLRGYVIPKGTYVIPNLDSVLHDKTVWGEDAMSFRPERFLDASGKLVDREEMIPFGIGRRVCLGEALANMELFLILSNLFQRFQFVPKDKFPPSYDKYHFGLVCAPHQYEVRLLERK